MSDVPRVLVVCTGNLCRSPLVEVLLRRDLAAAGIDAEVVSAGLAAPTAVQPDRRLRRVADELGVDVDEHRSRPVSHEDLSAADLILTMTTEQAERVRALDLALADRVVPLRAAVLKARVVSGQPVCFAEWVERLARHDVGADTAYDVADPIGGPMREYRLMGDEVRALVQTLVDRWSGR